MTQYYVCKFCGAIYRTSGGNCYICDHELYVLETGLNKLAGKTIEEIDEHRLKVQPKEKYNHAAWKHREKMDISLNVTGSSCPIGFSRKYQEGVVLPECPYCHGYYTKKIGAGSRLISTGIFGLGSKKIGKQWHCYFCDSDF